MRLHHACLRLSSLRLLTYAAAVALAAASISLAPAASAFAASSQAAQPGTARAGSGVPAQMRLPGSQPVPTGFQPLCPASQSPQVMQCQLLVAPGSAPPTAAPGAATPADTPAGLGPSDIASAYGLQTSSAGMRQTVAVASAFDDPSAASDLAAYRSQFGLPACPASNGCFTKTDQTGGTSYPTANTQWAAQAAAAMDMVSAVCPNCKILLVEANSNAITDLGTAVSTAVTLGASSVAMSFAGPESSADTGYDSSYFTHPGVAITAPAGDAAYGPAYPASSPGVTAVGGTTLTSGGDPVRGWSETAWAGTGSGCSAFEPKPSWQHDSGCAMRTANDLAADADGSPVAFYDTYNETGWLQGAGTSIASAITAATYALAGTPASGTNPASYPYAHPSPALNDITSGSNSTNGCSPAYLCTGGTGYDGPTGNGTPSFTAAFDNSGQHTGAVYSGVPGRCLDDKQGITTDTNPIDIFTCNTTSGLGNQNWTQQADGTVRIYGKCLDVKSQGTADGSKIDLFTCNGGANQQWRVQSGGQLVNPISGRCLDDPGSGPDGTVLDIFDCVTGAANEQWTQPYSTPTSTGIITTAAGTSKCVTNDQQLTADGNPINLFDCTPGATNQQWTIEPSGTLHVQGKCMDIKGFGTADGTLIDLFACNGQTNQQWRVLSDGELLNPGSGKCLDDPAGNTANRTQLDIFTCQDPAPANEIWNLPPLS